MQRAAVNAELRRELVRLIGAQEARVFLIRLGFLSGQADARLVRTRWPNLDTGDAFTAGTRLHTFSGVVRVETVFNEFDLRKKRLSAEFLWHDGVEAAEYRRLPPAAEPVCWTQLGYASGYASEFFDTLIVYKEVECAAQGHQHCRVVGKPADVWGVGDPDVILFRERIVGQQDAATSEPLRKAVARSAESALSKLDRLILAPVRSDLERLAPMALPVLLTGAPGSGRNLSARYIHRASGLAGGDLRPVFGDRVDLDFCLAVAKQGKGGRRSAAGKTILIDMAEKIPGDVQPHLARAIEEGAMVGGPRIIALATNAASGAPQLSCELRYALSALTVRMPSLSERDGERSEIARAMLPVLAARTGLETPRLDETAAAAIEREAWPGNLRQMHAVLGAVMVSHPGSGPVSRAEIEAQLAQYPSRGRGDRRHGPGIAAPDRSPDGSRRLLAIGLRAVSLPGGRGSSAWKLVCCGAPSRHYTRPTRLSPRHQQRFGCSRATRLQIRPCQTCAAPSSVADPDVSRRAECEAATHGFCAATFAKKLPWEIHEGLNVVENENSANGFVFFGKGDEMATNRH